MGPFQPPRYTEAFRPGNVEELRFRSFKDRVSEFGFSAK